MLNDILNLSGVQKLSKASQKATRGGYDGDGCPPYHAGFYHCPPSAIPSCFCPAVL